MLFQLSIILHIFGFTMLLGGMFIGLRAARMPQPPAELLRAIRFGYLVAGGVLVLATGLFQLFTLGASHYFAQGWFHGKLTTALLLLGLGGHHFVKFLKVERTGTPMTRRSAAIMHSLIGILFLAAVALTILGRQGMI